MKKQFGYTAVELFIAVIVLGGGIGWVWNIVKIIGTDVFWPLTGLLVLRIIGVFVPPIGAIVGYF